MTTIKFTPFKTYPKTKVVSLIIAITAIISIILYFGLKDDGFMRGEKVNQREGDSLTQTTSGPGLSNIDEDIRDPAVADKIGDTTNTGPVINEQVDNENVNVDSSTSTVNSQTTTTSPILTPGDFGVPPSTTEIPAFSEPPSTLEPSNTEPSTPFDTGFPQSQIMNVQHFDNINTSGRKTVNFDWPADKKLVEISFDFLIKSPLSKTKTYGIMENIRYDNSKTPRPGFVIFINSLKPELHVSSINSVGARETNVLTLSDVKILPNRNYFFDVKLYYKTESQTTEQQVVFSVESNDNLYQSRKTVTVDGQNSILLPINENFVHGNTILFGDDSCCNDRKLPDFEISDFNIDLSNNLK